MAHQVAFGASRQQYIRARRIDGRACCSNSFNRKRQLIQRLLASTCRIFNRKPCNAGFDAKPDIRSHAFWLIRVPRLEIGIDWQLDRRNDFRNMIQHQIARHRPRCIRQAPGKSESRTRCRECLKSKMAQISGGAQIPWVWNHKATALVELSEFFPSSSKVR